MENNNIQGARTWLIDFPEVSEHVVGAVLKQNGALTLSTVIIFRLSLSTTPAPVSVAACSPAPFKPKMYFLTYSTCRCSSSG